MLGMITTYGLLILAVAGVDDAVEGGLALLALAGIALYAAAVSVTQNKEFQKEFSKAIDNTIDKVKQVFSKADTGTEEKCPEQEAEKAKQEATRTEQEKKPTIHEGKQGKHQPGHNNFKPGRSELTHENPQELLDKGVGKGVKVGENKEVVDFEENIGNWVGKDGTKLPTTRGTIHTDSTGGAHIVPAHPTGLAP